MTDQTARNRRSEPYDHGRNIAEPVAPKPGVQFMVRSGTGELVNGRPDQAEQEHLAAGVGAMLRELRRERGMSLRELEARSGMTRSAIGRLERGQRRPRRSSLGWLAWGIEAERVVPLTQQLAEAAGNSLVAESRWSQRMHARRALRALEAGRMPVPPILFADRAVSALGARFPNELDKLAQVQEAARAGLLPWPDGMTGSAEALALADHLARLSAAQLAKVAQQAEAVNDFAALKARQQRRRALNAIEREAFMATRRRGRSTTGDDLMTGALAFRRATGRMTPGRD